MKIQESILMNRGDSRPVPTDRSNTTSLSFQKMLGSYSKDLTQERLQQILQEIDQQGQRLNDRRTFHELRKYKQAVKQFMDEVSKNGIGLEQGESWDLYGGNKTLKTIKIIDQKLLDLTNHVINEQSQGLSILDRIGEIKGMLINLYT
ncbi:MAG TPA: YaaR family protein [Bacillota bacterium]|nr:YaaR family protein [Bacillota bacterium]